MEFKVGDKVRIKPWEQVIDPIGISEIIWETLYAIYTITRVQSTSVYTKELAFYLPLEALIKIEEPALTPTFKHKVGDIVQIKSLDWYNNNKAKDGWVPNPSNYNNSFAEGMSKYCGKQYIVKLKNDYSYALADLDNKETINWSWQDYMFEDSIIENATVDKYSIGSTFTSNNNTYIVVENPKGGCIGCDLRNIYEECNSDRPKGFECLRSLRSDDKYVIAKKITPNDSKSKETSMDKYPIGSTLKHEDKEYIVSVPIKSEKVKCEQCALTGKCISNPTSVFQCSNYRRYDKTDVILKLKSESSTNAIPIDNDIVIIEGIPYIVVSNSSCTECTFYDNNDYAIKRCSTSIFCPLEGGESYQKVESLPTTIGMCRKLALEQPDLTPSLDNLQWNISEYAGMMIVTSPDIDNISERIWEAASLASKHSAEFATKQLTLEDFNTTSEVTVNSEIKLDSITIEYGVL